MAKKTPKKKIQRNSKIVSPKVPSEIKDEVTTTSRHIENQKLSSEASHPPSISMAGPSISYYSEVASIENSQTGKLHGDLSESENIGNISKLAIRIIYSTLSGTSKILNVLAGVNTHSPHEDEHNCSYHGEQHHPCCCEEQYIHHNHNCCDNSHSDHCYVTSHCNNVRGC